MEDLTNEQWKLLVSMYKEVLSRQPALPYEKANSFVDSDEVMKLFCPESSSEHVASLCWALASHGYIVCLEGSNLANEIELTDKTIILMENRFKNGLKSVLEFLAQFK